MEVKFVPPKTPIYLDYNATTPIHPEVTKEMIPYLTEHFGNPSSGHVYGQNAKRGIDKARKQVAQILGCSPNEITFTSGGTESNNLAIKGVCYQNKNKGNHIITSKIEHPAVLEVCKVLEKEGFDVTYLDVDEYGIIDLKQLEASITSKTILITIMHANNEVGTIQPIQEISKLIKSKGIVFHTDASQSIGKIPTYVNDIGVDLLTVCSHKFYGPKGVGALFIRNGVVLQKQMQGAPHENGIRAGTENTLEIVGLGKACEMADNEFQQRTQHVKEMSDLLWKGLSKKHSLIVKLNGHPTKRLPNTLSVSFTGYKSDQLIKELESIVVVSAGSACHAGSHTMSAVLKAMNFSEERAFGTLRMSTGYYTTRQEINKILAAFDQILIKKSKL